MLPFRLKGQPPTQLTEAVSAGRPVHSEVSEYTQRSKLPEKSAVNPGQKKLAAGSLFASMYI